MRAAYFNPNTGAKVSRQRAYQLAHVKTGLCKICPEKAVIAELCEKHREARNRNERRFAQKR